MRLRLCAAEKEFGRGSVFARIPRHQTEWGGDHGYGARQLSAFHGATERKRRRFGRRAPGLLGDGRRRSQSEWLAARRRAIV